ncbi:MAG: glycosyltransferase family 2 protein [Phaeovulum sp.]|uniref:glycosyltransferase family 2 protein n=1 Tax=Phaeovulum sp. TaxID=2934796 RepID=UPI00272F1F76|nr:glycosyltransferase family 2 protein [Phaeovulum sp.]MDP2062485.1 glycosyltransferase family 2 protein [Phaeovulum sp.]
MSTQAPRFLALLTVKNEASFLLDWLAHHRAAGFTDVLAVSNDCSDGSDAMLDRLAALGWLVHLRNPGPHPQGPQWSALKLAERHPLMRAADWVMTLDIDEFLNIHVGDRSLAALIAACPEADALALSWRMFGNCGVVDYVDHPLPAQFLRAAPAEMLWPWRAQMIKTLWRNDGTWAKPGVHRPRAPDPARLAAQRWVDGSGRKLPDLYRNGRLFAPLGQNNWGLAQINHYPLGSMQGYVVKCDRGRANRDAAAFDMSYWVERNFCTDDDASILALAPAAARWRGELAADNELAALHRKAVDWRAGRFAALMLEEQFRALFGRLQLAPPSQPLSAEAAARMLGWGRRGTEAEAATMARRRRD